MINYQGNAGLRKMTSERVLQFESAVDAELEAQGIKVLGG
jgi:hypothetical protein